MLCKIDQNVPKPCLLFLSTLQSFLHRAVSLQLGTIMSHSPSSKRRKVLVGIIRARAGFRCLASLDVFITGGRMIHTRRMGKSGMTAMTIELWNARSCKGDIHTMNEIQFAPKFPDFTRIFLVFIIEHGDRRSMWVTTYWAWAYCLQSMRVNCRVDWACCCIDWPASMVADSASVARLREIARD